MKRIMYYLTVAVLSLFFRVNACDTAHAMSVVLVPDNSQEMAENDGMVGRLYIPDLGIDVAAYDVTKDGAAIRQKVTDDEDSAAYFRAGTETIIADHTDQGFSVIENAVPGETVAYMLKGKTCEKYICVEADQGQNTTRDLYDKNGVSFTKRNDEGGFVTYTCYIGWEIIRYAVWMPVK